MGLISRARWLIRLIFCAAGVIACASSLRKIYFEEDINIGYINYVIAFVAGFGLLTFFVLSTFCLDILYLDPADSLSSEALNHLYKQTQKIRFYGWWVVRKYRKGCNNIRNQQERYLLNLLKHNAETLYGIDNDFSDIANVADFRNRIPLADYENFDPYIKRVCHGEKNVLTKDEVLCMAKENTTSGKVKLVPVTLYNHTSLDKFAYAFNYAPILKGAKLNMKKTVSIGHKSSKTGITSDMPVGSMESLYRMTLPYMASPDCVFDVADENTSFYVHAIFAFREREVGNISFLFAQQAYGFFAYAELMWQKLCDDIEQGTLTYEGLEIEDDLYVQIQNEMYPNKKRAQELRHLIRLGSVGLAKRIWPGLTYCRVTTSGSMEVYGQLIQDTYLKDVILVQNGYGASEGLFGINLSVEKNDPTYTLAYMSGFFEFIPEKNLQEIEPVTLLAHEVIVGKQYELVITNGFGLYRYRVGDIVRIVGLEGQCPVMEFKYRRGQVLDLYGEKTTETVFHKALVQSAEKLNVSLIDYTCCEDVHLHGKPDFADYSRHYTVFIELNRALKAAEMIQFDRALCEVSPIYAILRKRQSITAMEVIQVHQGTFSLLRDRMIRNTQNPEFRIPRTLRIKEHIKYLCKKNLSEIEYT